VSVFNTFVELIRRAQNHDQEAAAELMRRYEPAVRRAVRLRLYDAQMRRVFDSIDICQSVMGNFFDRLARGQFPLETPEQLVKLLVTMAHNKLTDHVRRQKAKRRNPQQVAGFGVEDEDYIAPGPTPSRQVELRELLEVVRRRLTSEEQRLLEMRNEGWDWNDIAEKLGGTAEALRKKLARALERVQLEVGAVSV
jgi:RNA polymerase sigma-70 factor (ECF subfamily)